MGYYYLLWMPSTFIHCRSILMRQERRIWEIKSSSKRGFSSLLIIPSFFFLLYISKVGLDTVKPAGVLGIRSVRYWVPLGFTDFFPLTHAGCGRFDACSWAAFSRCFPPSQFPFLLGFKGANEESVATFSSWNRNNGGGLEGGSCGISGSKECSAVHGKWLRPTELC